MTIPLNSKAVLRYGLQVAVWLLYTHLSMAELVYRNPRPYNVNLTFELEPDPAKIDRNKDLKVWLPLPREWESQKAVKIISMLPPALATYEDPEFGNRMALWDLGRGPETNIYGIQLRMRLEAYDVEAAVDPAKVGAYDKTNADYLLYTRSERTIALRPKVHELAVEAVGSETNPYLQARLMSKYVIDKVSYQVNDYQRGRGIDCLLEHPIKDPQTGKEQYEGCCNQRSALLVAMCRSLGIPARCVTGFVGWFPWDPANSAESFETNLLHGQFAGAEHFVQSLPHMWTEFYIPNYGWIPDDSVPEAWNGRVIFSKGRDILIGPDCPVTESEGYGSQWVPVSEGRADAFFSAVWNIAKIRKARVRMTVDPDPFPAEEVTRYLSHYYPGTDANSRVRPWKGQLDAESRLQEWRRSLLSGIYKTAQKQPASEAAVAAELGKFDFPYECGAFVIHMLCRQIGDEQFFEIVRQFQDRRVRSQAPVSTAEFQKLVTKVHGKSMDSPLLQWATPTNLPRLGLDRVTATVKGSTWHVRGHVLRRGSSNFRGPVTVQLDTEHGIDRQKIWMGKEDVRFEFDASGKPERVLVDPDFEVLKIQRMAPHLAQLRDAPPKILLVYGTLAEAAANKAAANRLSDDFLGLEPEKIKADADVTEEDLKTRCLCLFGRPKTNKITQRFVNRFPIQISEDGFVWKGMRCQKATQGVIEAITQPDEPKKLVVLFAGLGAEAMKVIGDLFLYDPESSYAIFDGDKPVVLGDWDGGDPDLVRGFGP